MAIRKFILVLLLSLPYFAPSRAQNVSFEWSFSFSTAVQDVQECQSLPISIQPRSADSLIGQPPFYMISYEMSGTPLTTMIGTSEDNLTWPVRHRAGTTLLLNLIDSQGNCGGTSPSLISVNPGESQDCIPQPSQGFTVQANNALQLNTCQPWDLQVSGGNPPYTITIAALNSDSVTNATMGLDDDIYTYINRVAPLSQVIGAVSDSTGAWANGTAFVKTTGSSDNSCKNQTSFSSSSGFIKLISSATTSVAAAVSTPFVTQSSVNSSSRPDATKSALKMSMQTVIGLCVALAVVVATGCAALAWFLIRRRNERLFFNGQDTVPRRYLAPRAMGVSGNNRPASFASNICSPASTLQPSGEGLARNASCKHSQQPGLCPSCAVVYDSPSTSNSIVIQPQDGGVVQDPPPPYESQSHARSSPPP